MNSKSSSFIVNCFEKKPEPQSFEDITRECKEPLSPESIQQLLVETEEAIKRDPKLLEEIWIQGASEEGEGGGVDRHQLKALLHILGVTNLDGEIDSILREADFDGDGNISADEFKKVINFFM